MFTSSTPHVVLTYAVIAHRAPTFPKLEVLTSHGSACRLKTAPGPSMLSIMAYAGGEFEAKVIEALTGEKGIIAPSYVHLDEGGGRRTERY